MAARNLLSGKQWTDTDAGGFRDPLPSPNPHYTSRSNHAVGRMEMMEDNSTIQELRKALIDALKEMEGLYKGIAPTGDFANRSQAVVNARAAIAKATEYLDKSMDAANPSERGDDD